MLTNFERELAELINKYSFENRSNTPDWILAHYLMKCLECLDTAIIARANWYNRYDEPGKGQN